MRRFSRLNRSRVIIIFNECTINGTGDLSIENEAEIDFELDAEILEGPRPLLIKGALDALAQVLRPVAENALGSLGIITKADVELLQKRTLMLEEAKPAARKPARKKASKKPAKKAAGKKKTAKKKASRKPAGKKATKPVKKTPAKKRAKKPAKKAPARKKVAPKASKKPVKKSSKKPAKKS